MLFRQTGIYMVAHGLSAMLGFLSVVLFTRLLSPAEYGAYVVAFSVAGIYSALVFTWVRLSILRFESEADGDVRVTALAAYGLSVAALPVLLLVTVYAVGLPVERAMAAVVLAAALGLFDLGQEILRARQLTGAYMVASLCRAVTAILVSLALVKLGHGGISLVIGMTAGYVVGALARARMTWATPRRPFDREVFRQIARFGIPMTLSGAVFALHSALDRLLVAYLMGDAAAGVYGVSADIVRQIIALPALAIGSAVAPVAIRLLSEEGPQAAHVHLSRSGEFLLATILPAVVGLAIVAPHLAALILGPEFRQTATELMPILVFACLFQAISQQFIHVSFHLAKKPVLLFLHGCVALTVNVAGMLVLVPAYGLKGAALSLVMAEAATVGAGYLMSRAAHPLPFRFAPVLKILGAVAFMAVPTEVVDQLVPDGTTIGLFLQMIVGVASYAVAVVALDVCGVRRPVLDYMRGKRRLLA